VFTSNCQPLSSDYLQVLWGVCHAELDSGPIRRSVILNLIQDPSAAATKPWGRATPTPVAAESLDNQAT